MIVLTVKLYEICVYPSAKLKILIESTPQGVSTDTSNLNISETHASMHQPKLQDELYFPPPINTPALFESITIYVSNLEHMAVTGFNDFMQLPRPHP